MKRSIQKRIIAIFAAALAVVIAACAIFSYWSSDRIALKQSRDYGRSGARLTEALISGVGLDAIVDPENTELYQQTREELRTICKAFFLHYLYLFTVDEANVRHYIYMVSSDDADDRMASETLGLGATTSTALHEQEIVALRGGESDKALVLRDQFGEVITWVSPYRDAEGNVLALIGTDYTTSQNTAEVTAHFATIIVPVTGALLSAFAALFILIRRRVIAPVRTISERMGRFDPAQKPEPLHITSRDEMQQIADSFEKMSRDIRAYIDNIERITEERAQAEAQMDAARRIQYGMVPAAFHQEKDGAEVTAAMQPAKEVGGDFYDSFFLDSGELCAVIGDVSGKGVSAALFMAMTKSMLREQLRRGVSPAEALEQVNDELCAANPEGMFVTVFAFVLDLETGELRYANGGHNPPLLLRAERAEYLRPKPGIALGMFEGMKMGTGSVVLQPGEGILLYTDGITEAINADQQFYGEKRLCTLLSEPPVHGSDAAVGTVKRSVEAFSTGCEQFDDMTLVSVFYRGRHAAETIDLPADMRSFDAVKAAVLEAGSDSPHVKKILLACDEAFSNIVSYSGAQHITFSLRRDADVLDVTFRDNGTRFDPFAAGASEEKDFDDLDMGGMGISLIRQIAARAAWRYEDGYNVLQLTFKLS